MNKEQIVQAWKDPSYRTQLSAEERTSLPESPSGKPLTDLEETDLEGVAGGVLIPYTLSPIFCQRFTFNPYLCRFTLLPYRCTIQF